jgi:hypothetical protein
LREAPYLPIGSVSTEVLEEVQTVFAGKRRNRRDLIRSLVLIKN